MPMVMGLDVLMDHKQRNQRCVFFSVKRWSFGWDYISALTSLCRLMCAEIAVEIKNVLH